MTGMGGSPPSAFDPATSPGYQVIQRLKVRDQLIKDAGWAGHPRDWDRIAFDVWTARAPGGRGVRLSTRAYPALADDPMAPTWIHVNRGNLRSVIEHFLGRREIEIASHYPRENAVRNGVSGWIGATEWSDVSPVPAPVYASHVLPSEAESMARELVDFLFWRDMGASGRIKQALALGAKPKAKSLPALRYTGPPPLAITIVPTTGEDFAMPMYLTSQRAMLLPPQPFWGKRRIGPDPDLPRRGNWFTGNEGDEDLAASAALLEQAAAPGDAPCDPLPQDPAWPPTWHVRIFDRMDGKTAHVEREFDVQARFVRCRALERYDAIKNKDDHLRGAMQTLSQLGVDQWAPEGNAPPPPQRQAPEDARAALIALARGPAGQPRTARLDLSLASDQGILVRLADLGDRPAALRKPDDAAIELDDEEMRAVLLAAMSHAAIGPGAERTVSTYPRGTAHGEIRVLERYAGLQYGVPVLIAFLPMADAEAVARVMVQTLGRRDPAAAKRLNDVIEFSTPRQRMNY